MYCYGNDYLKDNVTNHKYETEAKKEIISNTTSDYSHINKSTYESELIVFEETNILFGTMIEISLTGNESWTKSTSASTSETSIFSTGTYETTIKPITIYNDRNTKAVCTHFIARANCYNGNQEGFMIDQNGGIYIRINNSRLTNTTLDDFKKWLKTNKVKIITYKL